jgi:hypothetical protein
MAAAVIMPADGLTAEFIRGCACDGDTSPAITGASPGARMSAAAALAARDPCLGFGLLP